MSPRVIGHRLFADGVTRTIYEDERGQYVLDDDERVDGLFLVPAEEDVDEPVIIEGLPSA